MDALLRFGKTECDLAKFVVCHVRTFITKTQRAQKMAAEYGIPAAEYGEIVTSRV